MKNLENLEQFSTLNAEELSIVQGGVADVSKKKDVVSETNDSYKRDKKS